MTDLTGKQIANTYKRLIQVAVSTNTGVCATLQTIQSGDGTNSAMQLSNTAIRSTGNLDAGGAVSVAGGIHTDSHVCATAFYGSGAHLTSVSAALFSTSIDSFTANRLHVVTAASIAVLEVKTCASITNLVAPTGSFTTKVSGVAAEFSGNVCASEFYGDGSNLTGITAATSVAAMTINTLGVVTAASITSLVAPFGSFTTKVSGVAAEFSGIVSALTFDGALTGNVTGDLSGNVTGDIDGATGSFSACISSTNLVAATGSFTTKVSGVAAEFSGNVCAVEYYGDGSNLTNLPTASTSVAAMTINTLGVVTAASITSLVAPFGSFTTKVSGVAAEFSGNVCAVEYYGDGSNLTGITAATSVAAMTINTLGVVTAASITSLVAPHGSFTTKVSGVAAEFSGNVCASEFYGGGSNITGLTHPTSVAAMTINTLGVVTAASITSLVAPHGSFTTKVSGVAAEFSGIVSALTFDGALTGNVTGDLSGNVTGDIDGATGSFSACISSTNLVAATGSFTTKVSGVAAEFSGNVCAVEYYGDGSNLTNLPTASTSVAAMTINTLGVVTAASITSLVAPHGSFTTKVSGVAAEFSGAVSVGGGIWADGGAVFNVVGADADFRVESDTITDILKVDAGDDTTRIKGFIYEQQVISASISSTTHVIDLSKANVYDLTFLNNCSLSFSNVAPSGRAQDFTMIIRRTAAASISFDPIILTAGGVTLGLADTSGRTDVLTMFTVDGGSQFYTASSFLAAATVAA